MTPEDNFRRVVSIYAPQFIAAFKCSGDDAAAVFGNLGHESLGMTCFHEIGQPEGKGGYGWGQWTGPRRVLFLGFCGTNKLDPKSDEGSYRFLMDELLHSETKALPALRAKSNLLDKVMAFERAYERAGVTNYNSRLRWAVLAQQFMKLWPPTQPAPKEQPAMWSFLTTILTPLIRHGMTAAGGALVTTGVLDVGQSGAFANLATGMALGAGGLIWSWVKNTKIGAQLDAVKFGATPISNRIDKG